MKQFVKDERQGNMNSRKEYTIKIKVGLIGFGRMGQMYLEKLKRLNK